MITFSFLFILYLTFILLLSYSSDVPALSFIQPFRTECEKKEKRKFFVLFPLILAPCVLFFPLFPGPMILGDLVPAILLLLLSFNSMRYGVALGKQRIYFLFFLLLHLLFPSFILI